MSMKWTLLCKKLSIATQSFQRLEFSSVINNTVQNSPMDHFLEIDEKRLAAFGRTRLLYLPVNWNYEDTIGMTHSWILAGSIPENYERYKLIFCFLFRNRFIKTICSQLTTCGTDVPNDGHVSWKVILIRKFHPVHPRTTLKQSLSIRFDETTHPFSYYCVQ